MHCRSCSLLALLVAVASVVAVQDEWQPVSHWQNKLELINVLGTTVARQEAVSISVAPTTLTASGQWVTVAWRDVEKPSVDDWIGVYTGNVSVTEVTPVKYRYLKEDPSHLSTGSGSVNFRLVNMRDAVWFALFSGGLSKPVLIAKSTQQVTFANYNEPLQGHVAFTNSTDAVRVQWVTRDVGTPLVRYGTKSGTFPFSVAASTTTYTKANMCGPPATTIGWNVNPGMIHSAVLGDLLPDTQYFVQYGDANFGWSAEQSFTTPPAVGKNAQFSFIMFGDMGQSEIDGSMEQSYETPSLNTTRLMQAELSQHRMILHCGDISYARGYVSQWDSFFDQISGLFVPYMTNIGNHERDYPGSGSYYPGTDSGGECGVAYGLRMQMPRPSLDQPWYSFDIGSVHVLMFSTEHPFSAGTPQFNFIERDLLSVDRQKTPWVLVSFHRPMYIDSTNEDVPAGDQPVARELRAALEPLFLKAKVSLVITGHHHSAQRTCPVYESKCVNATTAGGYAAPIYYVVGNAGQSASTNIPHPSPEFWEFIDDSHYGYSRLHVSYDSLTVELVSDVDGSLLDTYTLARPTDLF